jgi:hypothetical protein
MRRAAAMEKKDKATQMTALVRGPKVEFSKSDKADQRPRPLREKSPVQVKNASHADVAANARHANTINLAFLVGMTLTPKGEA